MLLEGTGQARPVHSKLVRGAEGGQTGMAEIETERLLLRGWGEADREPFARMNADPRVMEYYPALLTRAESDRMIDKIQARFAERGYSLWAAELRATGGFIGYVGLSVPAFHAHFTPCVEIGWRLDAAHWGVGLATEGARAVVHHGFAVIGLDEILSFTTVGNRRSRRVMEKLGMTHDPREDFDHPNLPPGHPLGPHVLYRLDQSRYAPASF
jgi:RimJ/RimL family protein N-acetyltransferase